MRNALLCFCLAAASCGGGVDANHDGIIDGTHATDNTSMVAPSTPVGTLSGQVLSTDFKALDGVTVNVIIGGVTDSAGTNYEATTDNKGVYFLKGLPAAAFAQVTLSKAGYATARAGVFVPGTAGNFPVNNGNANVGTIMLTQLDDKFKVQVVTAAGHPAKAAKCTLEVNPAAVRYDDTIAGYGARVGIFVLDASTDDNGFVEFTNIPNLGEEQRLDGTFTVSIQALDEDVDGHPEFLGNRTTYTARSIYFGTASRVITLPYARVSGPMSVIASNIDSMMQVAATDPLKSMVKISESLYFVFDMPVIESSISVKITDELGTATNITANKMLKGPNILQVTMNPPVEIGKEYNIALRATSAENGFTFSKAAYFFGGDPTMPKTFAIEKVTYKRTPPGGAVQMQPNDLVVITFNQPVKLSGGNRAQVFISADLDGMPGATTIGEKPAAGMTNPAGGYVLIESEPQAEPTSTFTNMLSGYTTRHVFTYIGIQQVALMTQFTVNFSALPSSLVGYRTLWGTGVETDANLQLTAPP